MYLQNIACFAIFQISPKTACQTTLPAWYLDTTDMGLSRPLSVHPCLGEVVFRPPIISGQGEEIFSPPPSGTPGRLLCQNISLLSQFWKKLSLWPWKNWNLKKWSLIFRKIFDLEKIKILKKVNKFLCVKLQEHCQNFSPLSLFWKNDLKI